MPGVSGGSSAVRGPGVSGPGVRDPPGVSGGPSTAPGVKGGPSPLDEEVEDLRRSLEHHFQSGWAL